MIWQFHIVTSRNNRKKIMRFKKEKYKVNALTKFTNSTKI